MNFDSTYQCIIYLLFSKVSILFQIQTTLSVTEHSHPVDDALISATKVKATLKQQATLNRGTPGQLVSDAAAKNPVEVRAAMGNLESTKRTIRRQRAKEHPLNPTTTADLIIPEAWTTTGTENEDRFLIYDNGQESESRMLVFGTDLALQHLAGSTTWMMDGTFDVAPRIFSQLYVIRAPLGESAVSCVYALLCDKSRSTYEELLNAILNQCNRLGFHPDPETVITDFEQAAINAVCNVLGPHVKIHGCFYHLTQSTWRKIQALGLVTLYRESEDVRLFCGMLDGLAFLPLDRVHDGLQFLKENIPEGLDELVSYFDSTYVSGTFRRLQPPRRDNDDAIPPLRMRRLPALYPPTLWNVHTITINGESRTNNLCEAWNRGFSSSIGHAHPTIWTLIRGLRNDNALVETAIYRDLRGNPPKKRVRRQTKALQDRLKTLCSTFNDGQRSLPDTLQAIGHCIRWA